MRLLLINPNTTSSITELVMGAAAAHVRPDVHLDGATGRFGARYITTRAAVAVAAHATLDAYAAQGTDADGVVLACFGDPGIDALREIARQPVVGFADTACRVAAAQPGPFAIVTGGIHWGPMLTEFVAARGLADRLAAVLTVAPSGGDIARDPEGALALLVHTCRRAVDEHGAARVILGGAGLAGLADRVAPALPVPLIDPIRESMREIQARVRAGHASPPTADPVETVGLSATLTRWLAGLPSGQRH
jgi:allantoin racemase